MSIFCEKGGERYSIIRIKDKFSKIRKRKMRNEDVCKGYDDRGTCGTLVIIYGAHGGGEYFPAAL